MHQRINFLDEENLILWICGSERISYSKLVWYFENQERWAFNSQKHGKMIFSRAWNTVFTDYWKFLALDFPEKETRSFLSWKYGGKMIFADYCKFIVLNFLEVGNAGFSFAKKLVKDNIYWLLKSSCFELFDEGKYGLFLSQKVMEKYYLLITEKFLFLTFRRSFWAFHDIPGLGKYGFLCSD